MARSIPVRVDQKMVDQLDRYRDRVRDQYGMNLMLTTALRDMAVLGLAALEGGYAELHLVGLSKLEGDDVRQS